MAKKPKSTSTARSGKSALTSDLEAAEARWREEKRMSAHEREPRVDVLLISMLAYCAASLLHFAHNAVFIADYPNLPAWLSSAGVWVAWVGVTSIGVVGYVLMRLGLHLAGLATAAIYGALGFDGLAHYSLASFTAHTWTMNLTIVLEVVTAALLLIALTHRFVSRRVVQ